MAKLTDTDTKYASRAEAAKVLNVSIRSLDRAIADGTLPARRLGKRVLIPVDALDAERLGKPASPLAVNGGANK